MNFSEVTCSEFSAVLASKNAVPGGGGASALVGAVGTALGAMVGNLTVGKKKYADVESEMQAAVAQAEELRCELLRLIDADAQAFEPLSKAYSIPKDAPERQQVMEQCLRQACSVPMDIMRTVCRAIELHGVFAEKGSALALSDAGVGVEFCKAALKGASLNVFINTKAMVDKEYASQLEKEADEMLDKYCAMADAIYCEVAKRLRD